MMLVPLMLEVPITAAPVPRAVVAEIDRHAWTVDDRIGNPDWLDDWNVHASHGVIAVNSAIDPTGGRIARG